MTNRNYFCTGPGSTDFDAWEAMVAEGNAIRRVTTQFGGDNVYYLTMKAALSVREPNEHISREDAEMTRKIEEQYGQQVPLTQPPCSVHGNKICDCTPF